MANGHRFNLDMIFHILIHLDNINEICRMIKMSKQVYRYFLQHRDYLFLNNKYLVGDTCDAFFKDYINKTFIDFESGESKMTDFQNFLFNCETFGYKRTVLEIINKYNYIHRIYYTLINTRNQIVDDLERAVIKKKEWYRKIAFVFIQYGAHVDESTFVEAVVAMDKITVKFLQPLVNERSYINGIPIVFVLQARRAHIFFQQHRHNQRTTFISSIANSLYTRFRKKNWFDYFRNRHWTPKQYYDFMLHELETKTVH